MKVLVFFLLMIFFAICKANGTRLHPVCRAPPPKNESCNYGHKSQRAYYDAGEKKCKTFTFEGCDYSSNLFDSLQHCQDYCEKTPEELCRLSLKDNENGMACGAYEIIYYYKASEKKCIKFRYGGCFGNQNNFDTAEECEEFCANV